MISNLKVLLILLVLITATLKENYNSLSVILLSVFTLFYYFKNERNFNLKTFRTLSPLLLFFIITFLSVFYSEDKETAWKMVIRILPFFLFPFVFSVLKIGKTELLSVFKGYVYWVFCICIYSHFVVLNKLFKNDDNLYSLFNNNYSYLSLTQETIGLHSTYYAYVVLIAIIFVLYLMYVNSSKFNKTTSIILLVYFSFFIFHISARLPLAVMFLVYNVVIVYYFIKRKRIKQGAIFLLFLYIVSGIVLYNVRVTRYRFQQVMGFTYYDGSHHEDGKYKLRQWESSMAANENIILGSGIGDANLSIYESYSKFDLEKYKERKYNAHNQFIQTYVGLGLLGVLALLGIFVVSTAYFINHKNFIGVLFTGSSFLLFQTESFLERQAGIVLFTFLISLLISFIHSKINPT